MNKILRYSFVALLAMFCGSSIFAGTIFSSNFSYATGEAFTGGGDGTFTGSIASNKIQSDKNVVHGIPPLTGGIGHFDAGFPLRQNNILIIVRKGRIGSHHSLFQLCFLFGAASAAPLFLEY